MTILTFSEGAFGNYDVIKLRSDSAWNCASNWCYRTDVIISVDFTLTELRSICHSMVNTSE